MFNLLAYPIQHRDRLVRKGELLEQVWSGRVVSEAALTSRLMAARRAIVDRGQYREHYGAAEAYLPVLEAFGRLCKEPGNQALMVVVAQRAPTWLVQMPWLLHGAEFEALQRRLLGATRERLLREMAEAIEVLTAQRPLVPVWRTCTGAIMPRWIWCLCWHSDANRPDGTVAGRYAFIHALYHDVVYQRLAAARRVYLHRRIGASKEDAYGPRAVEVAAELAVHFEHGRDYGRAVRYLGHAADNAIRRYAVREQVEAMMALATAQGFPLWVASGIIWRGWVLAAQGHSAAGVTQMRQGMAAWDATGTQWPSPVYLALLAEAHGHRGHVDEKLRLLAQALAVVDNTGERWWEAELYRLTGELLLRQAASAAP
jgi:hypothetical protein